MEIIHTIYIISITLFLSNYHILPNVLASAHPINAIYQFGDSISDTGNMVYEVGNVGCARPPYGETAFRHPTGRCSDGLLIVDHFARAFKLPLVNPYLNRAANFSQGVNFAVVGATAMGNLPVQLGWFKSHLATICSNPAECNRKLQNALFVVGGIGGNDYGYGASQGKNMQDLYAMVPSVVQAITDTVKEVINLGAKRLIVPGSFPVGCMPICLGSVDRSNPASFDENYCEKSWNDLAAFHNTKLQEAIVSIKQQYPGIRIVYGDYFNSLLALLKNAAALGFDQNGLYQPCCSGCGSPGGYACPNPSAHVSWDGIHMTQHAYHFVAHRLLKEISML